MLFNENSCLMYRLYKKSFDADYYQDSFFSKNIPALYFVCFRAFPSKKIIDRFTILTKSKTAVIVFNILYFILLLLWIIVFPFYMIYECISFMRLLKKDKISLKTGRVIMGTTYHSTRMLDKVDSEVYSNSSLLTVPWFKIDLKICKKYNINVIPIERVLTKPDCLRALFLSILLSYSYIFTSPFSASLQTFLSYDFILVWLTMNKVISSDVEIIYMNFLDRWSVLFDNFPSKGKKIHVQHGEYWTFPDVLNKTIINNIDTLYYFDERTKKLMLEKVIKNKQVICRPIKHSLPIKRINFDNNNPVVFIIGATHAFKRQESLLKFLLSYKVNIILKPHPLNGTLCKPELLKRIVQIKELACFPDANLVIVADESSLGVEYEAMNYSVIWLREFKEAIETTNKIASMLNLKQ